MRLWLLLIAVFQSAAQPPAEIGGAQPSPGPSRWVQLEKQAQGLIEQSRKLGNWNEHYQYTQQAAANIFERYGFTSESDGFALEVMRAVDSKPPWMFLERMDTAMGLFARRYGLDDDQKATMQDIMFREATGMFARNAEHLMSIAGEVLHTRAEAAPFTAEQVARIAEMAQPLFKDGQQVLERTAGELSEILDDQQRQRLTADLDAALHRVRTIESESVRWARGEWSAEDWGLERDPIQSGLIAEKRAARQVEEAARAGESAGALPVSAEAPQAPAGERPQVAVAPKASVATGSTEVPIARPVAPSEPEYEAPLGAIEPGANPMTANAAKSVRTADNHPWAVYVRQFIVRFDLDDEQQQKAWLMYQEARSRASAVEAAANSHAAAASDSGGGAQAAGTGGATPADSARGAVSPPKGESFRGPKGDSIANPETAKKTARQFDALKRRLERLPTRAQRSKSASDEAPKRPAEAAVQPAAPIRP